MPVPRLVRQNRRSHGLASLNQQVAAERNANAPSAFDRMAQRHSANANANANGGKRKSKRSRRSRKVRKSKRVSRKVSKKLKRRSN